MAQSLERIFRHKTQRFGSFPAKAPDTRSDKLDENSRMRQDGWKIVSCVIPYDFCRMELDGVKWNAFRFIISSLLEKYNIIRAHCFKNKKSICL